MEALGKAFLTVIGIIAAALIICAMTTYPLMWAWNYVIPSVFGLRAIAPLEAFCLSFIANTLIKPSISKDKKD